MTDNYKQSNVNFDLYELQKKWKITEQITFAIDKKSPLKEAIDKPL